MQQRPHGKNSPTPPSSPEAERAVLGGILLENDAMNVVTEILRPDDFYSQANSIVFDTMMALAQRRQPIDQVTLHAELASRGKLQAIGDEEHLLSLTDTIPTVHNIESHAKIVREKSVVRKLITACDKIAAKGYGDYGDAAEFLDEAERLVLEVTGGHAPARDSHRVERRRDLPIHELPEPIVRYVMYHSELAAVPPQMIAVPLLTSLAAAIGTTRCLPLRRGWTVYPIIWSVTEAPSGGRKTPMSKAGLRPARVVHQEIMSEVERERAEYKKAKREDEATPPAEKRLLVSDVTIEALKVLLRDNPRGVLVCHDELGAWLEQQRAYKSGGEYQQYLELWSAGPVQTDRITREPVYVPRAAASFYGTTTPGRLARIAAEHGESGLLARFLVSRCTVGPTVWRTDDGDDGIASVTAVVRALQALEHDNDGKPVALSLSAAAEQVWAKWYAEIQQRTAEADGLLVHALAKLEEYAARLAIVIALARDPHAEAVDERAMRAGVSLAEWFGEQAVDLYRELEAPPEDRQDRELLRRIEQQGRPVTPRDLARNLNRYNGTGGSRRAKQDLRRLAQDGQLVAVSIKPGQSGGRPTTGYVVPGDSGDGDETPRSPDDPAGSVATGQEVTSPGSLAAAPAAATEHPRSSPDPGDLSPSPPSPPSTPGGHA